MRARPASSNKISLDAMSRLLLLFDQAEDVVLAQDQVIDAVDLDFAAGVLAEQDPVALLDDERADLTLLVGLAVADRDDLALGRFLLRGIGVDHPAFGLFFFGTPRNRNPT